MPEKREVQVFAQNPSGHDLTLLTNNEGDLHTSPSGLAPDGTHDRLRTVGNDEGDGQGVLAVSNRTPGGSEVKSTVIVIGATAAAVQTALTPTLGTKVRIISVEVLADVTADPDAIWVYFGTGTTFTTNPASIVAMLYTGAAGADRHGWPDGGGPLGAVDEVLSWRTKTETEAIIHLAVVYREE